MAQLLILIEQLLGLAVQVGPELARDVEMVMTLLRSGQEPTEAQLADISAALDRTHAALQAAVAARSATTGTAS